MRKVQLLTLFILLLAICSCSSEGTRIIERPIFSVRNTNTIEIDTVVLTDSTTVLHIEAFYRPNYWIKIISETYLQGGGEKYIITESDGIELDKEFYMPESGRTSFTLTFPAIPRSLKTIDFIEGDSEDSFKIYGIDLTGKATYPEYPKGLPQKVRNTDIEELTELPAPSMEIGKTTVNVHLLGYQKGLTGKKMTLYANSFYLSDQKEYEAIIDEENGTASFEFEQYGVNYIYIRSIEYLRLSGYVIPGDNVDIYVDVQESCRQNSPYHRTEQKRQIVYYTGSTTATINNSLITDFEEYTFDSWSPEFSNAIEGMGLDSYSEYVMNLKSEIENKIKTAPIPDITKELFLIDLRIEIAEAIIHTPNILTYAYRIKHNIPRSQRDNIGYKAPKLTPEYFKVLKKLNLNDPMMVYGKFFTYLYPSILWNVKDLSIITDDKEGILYDLQKCYQLPEKIENMQPLTTEDKNTLATIENPFYSQVCSALEKTVATEIEAAKHKTGYTICDIPKVPNNKLFDAIAAKYKGKVVLVDFWATWCGPCIGALKQTEPLKDTELKHDDLQFVYITGPSSPEVKWRTTIADVKGDHYRVSQEQWEYLSNQLGVQGIPSYAVIQKNGTYKLRNDLRDHNKMKNTLLELVK